MQVVERITLPVCKIDYEIILFVKIYLQTLVEEVSLTNLKRCDSCQNMIDIASLKLELDTLEISLRSDPRVVKVELLKGLIELYSSDNKLEHQPPVPDVMQVSSMTSVNVISKRKRRKKLAKRGVPKIKLVELEVRQYLLDVKSAHRSAIVKHLTDKNIMGGESEPIRTFATYMSSLRDIFEPDGRGNFSLIVKEKDKIAPVAESDDRVSVPRRPFSPELKIAG